MYCDLCEKSFCNYYYKRHLNTDKHIQQLKLFEKKVAPEEYKLYINLCNNNCKLQKHKKRESIINIRKGEFRITF